MDLPNDYLKHRIQISRTLRWTTQECSGARILYLRKLQDLGDRWDGHSAKSPNADSVEKATRVMRNLSEQNVLPPKRLVD